MTTAFGALEVVVVICILLQILFFALFVTANFEFGLVYEELETSVGPVDGHNRHFLAESAQRLVQINEVILVLLVQTVQIFQDDLKDLERI